MTESLTLREKQELYRLLEELTRRRSLRQIDNYFPAEGPLSRDRYAKHLQYFRLGQSYRERCFLAANRVGKTLCGAFETALHLTGEYPEWWEGRRFDHPVHWWAAGDTRQTTRDIQQLALLGPVNAIGTGMIPGEAIERTRPMQGVPDAVDTVAVKHKSGGTSILGFKSYDQGRKSFQGTAKHGIWADEECPSDVYTEMLVRTMTTKGLVLLTFTPLSGLTELVLDFLPGGAIPDGDDAVENEGKVLVMASWDDAPHLTDEDKAELLASMPPHQREARTKGVPQLGAGAIYPVPETDIVVDPFPIPGYWPRLYGLDVGWKRTAAIWGAHDRETDTIYLYAEHYRGEAEPAVHGAAIKAKGDWIPGVIDPASRGRAQADGKRLIEMYQAQGLNLEMADNAVEAGIMEVYERLSTGRLKVFKTLGHWLSEYRIYRRDEKGRVVKESDHLMDATRYLAASIEKARLRTVVRARSRGRTVLDSTMGL